MNPKRGVDPQRNDSDGARRAITFMAAKFGLFAVLPVIVAALIVYVTLPD